MFAQESVMAIKKEREAFLNVYVNYKGDSRKIQFNEETEQFMWRKNNVSDTEVEYVHLMNQRWYAWLACAKSKAQAVPAGFVLVPKEPTDKTIAHMINTPIEVNLLCDHADTFLSEGEAYIAYHAMVEAQEQGLLKNWKYWI